MATAGNDGGWMKFDDGGMKSATGRQLETAENKINDGVDGTECSGE